MPTDEQRMREQFDAFVYERTVNRNMSGPWPTPTELAWLAWQARDAEVQALREALAEVTEDLASELIAKYGPIQAHPDTVRRFDRDMDTVYRARKLLAGGEGGEPE